MISSVISLVVILVTETYSQGFSHGHSQSHNHAYSSQSITMHQDHQEPVYHHHLDPYNDEFENNDHIIPQHHLPNHQSLYKGQIQNNHQNLYKGQIQNNHQNLYRGQIQNNHQNLYKGQIQNNHQNLYKGQIQNNHHIQDVPDHRHLYNEETENNYQNHLIDQNDHVPDHRNLYKGQPIVVSSGYKEMPLKDHQQMPFKQQKMPFHIKQNMPIKPYYNMPSYPFEHLETPVYKHHRTPVKIDSHKHMHHVNRIPHREYEFNYNIEDKLTGDHKAHHETRNDGVVEGVYSFQEADGSIRIVEYTADAKNGFHAKVRHEGQKHKVPKHNKNYSHRPRYHPQHNNLHPLLFNAPKY